MTDISALKAAIAALSPMPVGTQAIYDDLAVKTGPVTVDVLSSAVETILVPTGEFFAIYQMSIKPLSGTTPPAAEDAVIGLCWSFYRMLTQFSSIQTSSPSILAAVTATMGELQTANILTAASIASINALINQTTLEWPGLEVRDVWLALGQPAI